MSTLHGDGHVIGHDRLSGCIWPGVIPARVTGVARDQRRSAQTGLVEECLFAVLEREGVSRNEAEQVSLENSPHQPQTAQYTRTTAQNKTTAI